MKQEQKKKIVNANRSNRWGNLNETSIHLNARQNSSSVEEASVEKKLEPTHIETTNFTQGSKKRDSPNAIGTMTSDSRAGRRTVLQQRASLSEKEDNSQALVPYVEPDSICLATEDEVDETEETSKALVVMENQEEFENNRQVAIFEESLASTVKNKKEEDAGIFKQSWVITNAKSNFETALCKEVLYLKKMN